MNGFYALGGEGELRRLAREVARLDVVPPNPPLVGRPTTYCSFDYSKLNGTLMEISPNGLKTLGGSVIFTETPWVETRREFVNGVEVEVSTNAGAPRCLQVFAR